MQASRLLALMRAAGLSSGSQGQMAPSYVRKPSDFFFGPKFWHKTTATAQAVKNITLRYRVATKDAHITRAFVTSSPPYIDELPFSEYSPESNAEYWETRPVTIAKRTLTVSRKLGGFLLGRWNDVPDDPLVISARADNLRSILTELGPAFVKIGQAFSSRPDVVPPLYLKELEKLQDQIPPFCNEEAFAVIESELGAPVSHIFSSISSTTVAAASLGQVYKATLTADGSEVAVKVQRPGVATSIAMDVYILRYLSAVVKRVRKLNSDLPALLDEWAYSLFRELDYRREAANGLRFGELFGHLEGVYVPQMRPEFTTRRVLVMEWVEGERLRSAYSSSSVSPPNTISSGSEDDLRLVEIGVRCSLEQMLESGFYHADPHPGNLLRTRDGKLAYLDFGMTGEIDATIRQGLMRATLHLVNREYGALAEDFVTLGMLPSDADQELVVPALTGVFAEALKGGVNNLSFGDLSAKLGQTMYQFQFRIPSYYTLLVRSLSVLEGIALASDRNYKVLGSAYPWIARRLLTDTTPELRSTLRALLYKGGRFNFSRMESLLTQAIRPSAVGRRPSQAQQKGDALALLLSTKGEFVRSIIVEELAKGLDAAIRVAGDSAIDSAQQQVAFVAPLLSDTFTNIFESIPELADEEDKNQIKGITHLASVVQQATYAASERQQEGGWFREPEDVTREEEVSFLGTVESLIALLAWLIKEAESLDSEQRCEAMKLPIEIGEATLNRSLARFIKAILAGDPNADANPSNRNSDIHKSTL